jgi:hypothetical protein
MDIVTAQTMDLGSMLDNVVPVAQLIMSAVMNANGLHLSSSIRESGAAANYLVGLQHACRSDYIVQGVRTFNSVPCRMMPERAIERAAWTVAQSSHRRSDANGGGSWPDSRPVIRLKFWRKFIGARCGWAKRSFGDAMQHNRYFSVGENSCHRKAVLG